MLTENQIDKSTSASDERKGRFDEAGAALKRARAAHALTKYGLRIAGRRSDKGSRDASYCQRLAKLVFLLKSNPVQKITLQFDGLAQLASFSKTLSANYILNTTNLTLTTSAGEELLHRAVKEYRATVIPTSEKVFAYGVVH